MRRDLDPWRPGWVGRQRGRGAGVCTLALLVAFAACRTSSPPPAIARGAQDAAAIAAGHVEVYRRAGFLASSGTMPFVGAARLLAGPTPDTALVLLAFSLSNRVLTFMREGDIFAAAYVVTVETRADGRVLHRTSTREQVRVASFRETTRPEESVLFQTLISSPPGRFQLMVRVEDATGPNFAVAEAQITVPRFTNGDFSSPVPVLGAQPRSGRTASPRLIANPRATVVFGRDSTFGLYVEGYGPAAPSTLAVEVASDRGTLLYRDTIALPPGDGVRGAVAHFPVARLGVGVLTMVLSPTTPGGGNAERFPIVVSLGEELAISSFEDMLEYLRFFASAERLQALRDPGPDARAVAWTEFLRETDPDPLSGENEALRDYLRRVQLANSRYREEGIAGWRTDRGMVFSALGEPDTITEPQSGDANMRGRTMIWSYEEHRAEMVFVDQTGFGRWRLTPAAEGEFQALLRRITACPACR